MCASSTVLFLESCKHKEKFTLMSAGIHDSMMIFKLGGGAKLGTAMATMIAAASAAMTRSKQDQIYASKQPLK
ncbi:hypothetical protein V6N13_084173 [Hibiscus sabdariffa]|uniref:Uncharacterized protein n=1 Tax=Hibiscus sabdariffa TaxID=183260 RepID=A0ABR2T115_9ROSI